MGCFALFFAASALAGFVVEAGTCEDAGDGECDASSLLQSRVKGVVDACSGVDAPADFTLYSKDEYSTIQLNGTVWLFKDTVFHDKAMLKPAGYVAGWCFGTFGQEEPPLYISMCDATTVLNCGSQIGWKGPTSDVSQHITGGSGKYCGVRGVVESITLSVDTEGVSSYEYNHKFRRSTPKESDQPPVEGSLQVDITPGNAEGSPTELEAGCPKSQLTLYVKIDRLPWKSVENGRFFHWPVYDDELRSVLAGYMHGNCVRTEDDEFLCDYNVVLNSGGHVGGQGIMTLAGPSLHYITGGTGKFCGARGQLEVSSMFQDFELRFPCDGRKTEAAQKTGVAQIALLAEEGLGGLRFFHMEGPGRYPISFGGDLWLFRYPIWYDKTMLVSAGYISGMCYYVKKSEGLLHCNKVAALGSSKTIGIKGPLSNNSSVYNHVPGGTKLYSGIGGSAHVNSVGTQFHDHRLRLTRW